MALTTYLVHPFETTHENSFFKEFTKKLENKLKNDSSKSVLIGNLCCGGHYFDAIFIKSGAISIIDFKNYSGKLEFSENNPWKLWEREDNFVYVSGGKQLRNPYQQVNAYRFSLMGLLNKNQAEILDKNHIDIKWDHINCIVFFQGVIKYQSQSIPSKVQSYFSIADANSGYDIIIDHYSKNLFLNNNEIENILRILDIRPENIFNLNSIDYKLTPKQKDKTKKIHQIDRLITGVETISDSESILKFYETLVKIENLNSPKISEEIKINFKLDDKKEIIKINLSEYPSIKKIVEANRNKKQFPKNLYIGLNFLIQKEELCLLEYVMFDNEVLDDKLNICLDDFNLNVTALEKKGFPEDLLDELINEVNAIKDISGKIEKLKEKIDLNLKITNVLTFGLSEGNPYTVQLLSELKKLSKSTILDTNQLLKCYLTNYAIQNGSISLPLENFIQINSLNSEQIEAIKLSFNQILTVITGPPGTGKTQVVLNIIANALVNKRKVLFASKNHKAIDNVAERLSKNLKYDDYFIKYGNKDFIRKYTIAKIEKLVNVVQQKRYDDNTNDLTSQKTKLEIINNRIKEIKKIYDELTSLGIQLEDINNLILKCEGEYTERKNSANICFWELFIEKKIKLEYDKEKYLFKINKMNICKENKFLRFLFNLFLVKKYYDFFNLSISMMDNQVITFLKENIQLSNRKEELLITMTKFADYIMELDERIKYELCENSKYEKCKIGLLAKKDFLENKIKSILVKKDLLSEELTQIQEELPKLGLSILDLTIGQQLFELNSEVVKDYLSYLPNNFPWKDSELMAFEQKVNEYLNNLSVAIVPNLSVKNAFPLITELFDLVVIDEASQCDIASALPLIARAKQLVIIGDPLQLTHIASVKEYEEKYLIEKLELENYGLSYVKKSLFDFSFDLAVKSKMDGVFLKEHFRSHPEIIEYSNNVFYKQLRGQELLVKTSIAEEGVNESGLIWLDVKGQMNSDKNINILEIEKTIEVMSKMIKKYPKSSYGITTPFRHQADLIKNKLPDELEGDVIVDVVHKFQGDEKDIMIFSLVVCEGSKPSKAKWLNETVPYLINVAITRAKKHMIIVGDYNYALKTKTTQFSPIYELAQYAKNLGKVKESV